MKSCIATALVLSPLVLGAAAGPACGQPSRTADKPPAKLAYIVAFDFLANDPKAGASVADRLRQETSENSWTLYWTSVDCCI